MQTFFSAFLANLRRGPVVDKVCGERFAANLGNDARCTCRNIGRPVRVKQPHGGIAVTFLSKCLILITKLSSRVFVFFSPVALGFRYTEIAAKVNRYTETQDFMWKVL